MAVIGVFTIPDDIAGGFTELLAGGASLADGNYAVVPEGDDVQVVVADAAPVLSGDPSSVPVARNEVHPITVDASTTAYVRGRAGTRIRIVT